jgi:hypothetical protein
MDRVGPWPCTWLLPSADESLRLLREAESLSPARAVRSAGVAYLPTCGFQKFHPVGFAGSIAGDTPNPAAVTEAARYIKTLRDSGQLTSLPVGT